MFLSILATRMMILEYSPPIKLLMVNRDLQRSVVIVDFMRFSFSNARTGSERSQGIKLKAGTSVYWRPIESSNDRPPWSNPSLFQHGLASLLNKWGLWAFLESVFPLSRVADL
jgi:hypothetical protein